MSTSELALIRAASSPAMEGSRKTLLNERFANPRDSGLRDLNGFGNSIVDPGRSIRALVSFEEDAGVRAPTSRCRACGNQALKLGTLWVGQDDWILLIHPRIIPTPTQEITLRVTEY